jgi:hypothetical protein
MFHDKVYMSSSINCGGIMFPPGCNLSPNMSISRSVKDQVDQGASHTLPSKSVEFLEKIFGYSLQVRLFFRVFLMILDGIVNALGHILNGDSPCCWYDDDDGVPWLTGSDSDC